MASVLLPTPLPPPGHDTRRDWAAHRRQIDELAMRIAAARDAAGAGPGALSAQLPHVSAGTAQWRRFSPSVPYQEASPGRSLPPCRPLRPAAHAPAALCGSGQTADRRSFSVQQYPARLAPAEAPIWAPPRRSGSAAGLSASASDGQRTHTAAAQPRTVLATPPPQAAPPAAVPRAEPPPPAARERQREQQVIDAISKWVRSQHIGEGDSRHDTAASAAARSATQPAASMLRFAAGVTERSNFAPARGGVRSTDQLAARQQRQQQQQQPHVLHSRDMAPPAPHRRYISPAPPPPPPPPEYRYTDTRSVTPAELPLRPREGGLTPSGSDAVLRSSTQRPRSPLWTPPPELGRAATATRHNAAAARPGGRFRSPPRGRGKRHQRPELWQRRQLPGSLWVQIPED